MRDNRKNRRNEINKGIKGQELDKKKNNMKNSQLLINESRIDWQSGKSHYFFNTRHPRADEFEKLAHEIPILKAHIYLYTSSYSKICLLSKKALLFSARLANQNLQASSKDRWLISLPFYHVSGLSILARAFLSESSFVIQNKNWSPLSFQQIIEKEKITLSSLIPTQVYDLTQNNLKAPSCLRALLVGGDSLSTALYKKAKNLGWPLLPCYGATETSSHIAAASLDSLKKKSFPEIQTEMKLLEGIEIYPLQKKGSFKVKSKGLLTAYFDLKSQRLFDPKEEEGSFFLEDQLSLKKNSLKVESSAVDQIKILGEKVNLKSLRLELKKLKGGLPAFLLPLPDKRRAWSLVLVGEIKDFEELFSVMKQYNKQVLAYERIQALYFLDQALQNEFLKLKSELVLEKLGF